MDWYCSEPRLAFNRTAVLRYRNFLEQKLYAATTMKLCLAAVRRVAYEASDSGLLSQELASPDGLVLGGMLGAGVLSAAEKNNDRAVDGPELNALADSWLEKVDIARAGKVSMQEFQAAFPRLVFSSGTRPGPPSMPAAKNGPVRHNPFGVNSWSREDHNDGLSWIRRERKGGVFYCTHGHSERVYASKPMLEHLLAGTAAG